MNNSTRLKGILKLLITGGVILGVVFSSGMVYNWIEPESIFGVFGFLLIWGILIAAINFLGLLIFAILGENN